MPQILPIAFEEVKTSNPYEKLVNKIRKIIYYLY